MNNIWLIFLTTLFGLQATALHAGDQDALFKQCAENYLATVKKLARCDLEYDLSVGTTVSREAAFRGEMKVVNGPFSWSVLSDSRFTRTIYKQPGETTGMITYLGDKYSLTHHVDANVASIEPKKADDSSGLFDLEIQGIGRVSHLLTDCLKGAKTFRYEGGSDYQGHTTETFVVDEQVRLRFVPDFGYQPISIETVRKSPPSTEWAYDLFYEDWREFREGVWYPERVLCFSEHSTDPTHGLIESKVTKFNCDPTIDPSEFTASLPAGTQFGITINGGSQQTTLTTSAEIDASDLSSIVLRKQLLNLQTTALSHPFSLLKEWRANPEGAAYLRPFLIAGFTTITVSIAILIWWLTRPAREKAKA